MKTATNVVEQFSRVTEHWSPKVIGRVNDQFVKIAKVQGEFAWHAHDAEDELFLVIRGRLTIQLEDGDVELGEGDFYVVPRGVRHKPVAADECWMMLIETVTTLHTGDVETPFTRTIEEQLAAAVTRDRTASRARSSVAAIDAAVDDASLVRVLAGRRVLERRAGGG